MQQAKHNTQSAHVRSCPGHGGTWKIYTGSYLYSIFLFWSTFPPPPSLSTNVFLLYWKCGIYLYVEFFKEKHLGWIEDIDSEQGLISYLSRSSPGQLGRRKFSLAIPRWKREGKRYFYPPVGHLHAIFTPISASNPIREPRLQQRTIPWLHFRSS